MKLKNKNQIVEIQVESIGYAEAPSISAFYPQADGNIFVGLAFAKDLLGVLEKKSFKKFEFRSLKLTEELEDAGIAITHGLRSSLTKQTSFALLHKGALPGFVSSMAGADLKKKSGLELLKFLAQQDGGFVGAHAQHSVIEMDKEEIKVRRFKEPGVLLDVALVGEFFLGLTGSSIWREPYLQSEKRETIRGDLTQNMRMLRDGEQYIWLQSESSRFVRMIQTDVKATPTPLKRVEEDSLLLQGVSSYFDHWLYALSAPSHSLFRLRRNPISREEEMDKISLDVGEGKITALEIVPHIDKDNVDGEIISATLFVAVSSAEGVKIFSSELKKCDDAEDRGEIPVFEENLFIPAARPVGHLKWDTAKNLWAAESYLGWGESNATALKVFALEI